MFRKLVRRLSDVAMWVVILGGAVFLLAWLAPSSGPEKKAGAVAPTAKQFPGEYRGPSVEEIAEAMDGPGAVQRSVSQ